MRSCLPSVVTWDVSAGSSVCQRWARVVYNRHARPEQTPICFHMETTVTTGNIGPQVFLPMGSRGRFGARNRSPDQERLQSARGTSQSARDVESGSPRQMVSYAFILHVCALCARERRNREGAGLPHCSPVQDESLQNRESRLSCRVPVCIRRLLKKLFSPRSEQRCGQRWREESSHSAICRAFISVVCALTSFAEILGRSGD